MRTLYIGGLPPATDASALDELLSKVEGFVRARVIAAPSGRCRGFGYVTFATEEAARRALARLDGIAFRDARLRVAPAV